jgi:hypothetical protein
MELSPVIFHIIRQKSRSDRKKRSDFLLFEKQAIHLQRLHLCALPGKGR